VLVTESVSDRELIEALGGQLDGRAITGLRRRPYRYATSAPLEDVRVATQGGEEVRLILKDLSRERLLGDARATKPEFLHEPSRELDTYRRILDPAGIGPRCFAAVAESDPPRHWLLLERVPGVELWQVGELSVWEQVAGWLGRFHGEFGGRLDEVRAANARLLDLSGSWFRSWCARARAALARSDDARARALLGALDGYDSVADELMALPRAFVHGELYPSNVLVVRSLQPVGVYPVDWEMAGIGPAPLDLAALAGGWGAGERGRLATAYLDGLSEAGASIADEDVTAGLDRCRLHLALQWLGWSAEWRPPPEHAHDWLGEALALAQELRLA
jgi:aminoglycoside phosphotransferase (APT) family kinase protein